MPLTRSVQGTHLAVSWLTVLPVPQPRGEIDRPAAARAIAATPVVGVLLGAVAAGLAAALSLSQLPSIVVGALVVATLGLLTRGMHVDGLADTVDGLGCYGPPERAREVMHSGGVGPFGAAALVVVLLVQAAGLGALAGSHEWSALVGAVALGRLAVLVACRRGLVAATGGFGALVADSQRVSIVVWTVLALVGAAFVDIDVWWRGVTTVGVVLAVAWVVSAHCARRFGGVNGDVLGAVLELGTTVAVVGFLI
ncbi:adenosylcobinamide-GDP ribazoletransferase [Williamsia phyllosphaerae]|uniref:Adenosylcobinamide-GDP ribazoletransferase n=1 Tax=Williamsia phyllosphaerae TaxID=885042 RepID=A0ABQ1UZC7_9NOCA|nr:adenosylcobinamide-GDP ribazoletransferase [Williamsia phyllosphaerae]GGF29094.1 adenosylcobinamide-GDP ribazoletransferase [Williamsia phyllosphaerae]